MALLYSGGEIAGEVNAGTVGKGGGEECRVGRRIIGDMIALAGESFDEECSAVGRHRRRRTA